MKFAGWNHCLWKATRSSRVTASTDAFVTGTVEKWDVPYIRRANSRPSMPAVLSFRRSRFCSAWVL